MKTLCVLIPKDAEPMKIDLTGLGEVIVQNKTGVQMSFEVKVWE